MSRAIVYHFEIVFHDAHYELKKRCLNEEIGTLKSKILSRFYGRGLVEFYLVIGYFIYFEGFPQK